MTAALLLAFAFAAPPDDYNLAWKLKEGDTFFSQGKVVLDQTMTVMGKDIEQSMTSETVMRYTVKSVKPGATVVEMTYLSNKTTATGIPGADAANDKLKGVALTATLNGKMEVTKLEGYDKILDALAGNNEQARAAIKATLPEAALKHMLNETFTIVPGGPTKLGGTWKTNTKIPVAPLGDVEAAATFKLDSVKGDAAQVSWSGKGAFKGSDGQIPGVAAKFTKIDFKTEKLAGSFAFDLTTGRLTETKTQMEMAGTMTLTVGAQDVTIDAKQKLTQTAKLTDKNPLKD